MRAVCLGGAERLGPSDVLMADLARLPITALQLHVVGARQPASAGVAVGVVPS